MTLLSKNIWLIPRKIISAKFLIAINLYRFLLDRIYRIKQDKHKNHLFRPSLVQSSSIEPEHYGLFYSNSSAYRRERRDRITTPFAPFTKGGIIVGAPLNKGGFRGL